MTAHYRIKNWERFQHYNKPRPVWIKLHRSLLDDHAFHSLSARSRALLVMLWLIAAESDDGTIPDEKAVSWRLRLPEREVTADIQALTHYLEPLYTPARVKPLESDRDRDRDRDREETENAAGAAVSPSDNFPHFWQLHPYGPKKDARDAYRKARKAGAPDDGELMAILSRQVEERREAERNDEFCAPLPHLCRWFSKQRWEDAPRPKKHNPFLDSPRN